MQKESRSDIQSASVEEPSDRAELVIILKNSSGTDGPVVWRREDDRPSFFDRLRIWLVRNSA